MHSDEINKTPRTDNAWPGHKSCDIDFARQLERELNEAKKEIERLGAIKVLLEPIRK